MLLQRASAFSRPVVVANIVAFSEKVEVLGCCYEEPQPLVVFSLSRIWLPFLNRLRLREVETKSLSL